MRWRDTSKLFQMAGPEEEASEGQQKGRGWGERRNEIQQRAFSIQMKINSESHNRVDEEPLADNAEGAMTVDTDRWGSVEGPEQKMGGHQERSNHVQTMVLDSVTHRKSLRLKILQMKETGNMFHFLLRQKPKCIIALDGSFVQRMDFCIE